MYFLWIISVLWRYSSNFDFILLYFVTYAFCCKFNTAKNYALFGEQLFSLNLVTCIHVILVHLYTGFSPLTCWTTTYSLFFTCTCTCTKTKTKVKCVTHNLMVVCEFCFKLYIIRSCRFNNIFLLLSLLTKVDFRFIALYSYLGPTCIKILCIRLNWS